MQNNTAIIIDDESHARSALRGIIEENIPNIEIIGEGKNLPEGIKLIQQLKPDIVLLDIEMPEFSGLEILDFFPDEAVNFKLIFVTAYSQYALNAFQLSAIDYIVKPVQLKDLNRAFAKIEPTSKQDVTLLRENFTQQNLKISLNANGIQEFIDLDDILYIKADGSYSHIVLEDRKICITKRLAEFEKLEDVGSFLRIHRSHMINLSHIKKISKMDGGVVYMTDGAELSISKDKKVELESKMGVIRI